METTNFDNFNKAMADKNLSDGAKLIFTRIPLLTKKEGICWASNSFFAEIYGKSERTIQRWINELKKNSYILCTMENKKGHTVRLITINANTTNMYSSISDHQTDLSICTTRQDCLPPPDKYVSHYQTDLSPNTRQICPPTIEDTKEENKEKNLNLDLNLEYHNIKKENSNHQLHSGSAEFEGFDEYWNENTNSYEPPIFPEAPIPEMPFYLENGNEHNVWLENGVPVPEEKPIEKITPEDCCNNPFGPTEKPEVQVDVFLDKKITGNNTSSFQKKEPQWKAFNEDGSYIFPKGQIPTKEAVIKWFELNEHNPEMGEYYFSYINEVMTNARSINNWHGFIKCRIEQIRADYQRENDRIEQSQIQDSGLEEENVPEVEKRKMWLFYWGNNDDPVPLEYEEWENRTFKTKSQVAEQPVISYDDDPNMYAPSLEEWQHYKKTGKRTCPWSPVPVVFYPNGTNSNTDELDF